MRIRLREAVAALRWRLALAQLHGIERLGRAADGPEALSVYRRMAAIDPRGRRPVPWRYVAGREAT